MTTSIFFELIIEVGNEPHDRWEIEEQLEEVLNKHDLGEVTGGGSGEGKTIIDIELNVNKTDEGIAVIRLLLQCLNPSSNTKLRDSRTDEYIAIC